MAFVLKHQLCVESSVFDVYRYTDKLYFDAEARIPADGPAI